MAMVNDAIFYFPVTMAVTMTSIVRIFWAMQEILSGEWTCAKDFRKQKESSMNKLKTGIVRIVAKVADQW